ncbi:MULTISPECIES: PRC-barrel domain-containing protein [unclassified Carboxylicivirga]|uniref:PRC-barrel domain-containing protein n=1 Tax=Carboxylicivirga TaxID=1628153 RepID=UPI003D33E02B
MNFSLKNLTNYNIRTKDGEKAEIVDLLFDEEQWRIRYVQVDLETLNKDKKVLIPRSIMVGVPRKEGTLQLDVEKALIANGPTLEQHAPVSLRFQEIINKNYGVLNYWDEPFMATGHVGMASLIPTVLKAQNREIEEEEIKTLLRSFNEVLGYQIRAKDGALGHVEDLIVREEDWQVAYAVVDTSNWLPWSKKVLIPLSYLQHVSYVDEELSINMDKDAIKHAPEYDPSALIDHSVEQRTHSFYEDLVKLK